LKGVTLPERLGTTGNMGPIVTRGGLVFIGGGDPLSVCFDKSDGREIARVATPQRTTANPMTYRTRAGVSSSSSQRHGHGRNARGVYAEERSRGGTA
jgi:glucose dehydrogenase